MIESIPYTTVNLVDGDPASSKRSVSGSKKQDRFKGRYPTDVTCLEHLLSDLTLSDQSLETIDRQQQVLRSLNFETRSDRQDNIPEAHKSTFKWVFSDDEPVIALQDERSAEGSAHFRSWLRSGDGTFWILGKPGAGKSTLMKFITSHKKTVRELRRWSGPKGLVIAKHYFWSIGTAMQKSLKGLLQELLYDILCNCPELIPQVFPDRWQEVKPGRLPPTGKWSTETLLEGLTTLVQYPDIRFKFCAFIDGLDEFAGDQYDLCQIVKQLSSSTNFKCCVSSRPLNVFQDAFAADLSKKMCVHDFTYWDIWHYTKSKLEGIQAWRICADDYKSERLFSDVTERAQGVFLWVFLVVRSLRDGVINGDTMDDLERHLEALPSDLEAMFRRMLDLIDPFYHRYMSETLQVTINARKPLHLMTYHAREYERQDEDYATERPLESSLVLTNLPRGLLEPCRRRINTRCGGLIDFHKDKVEFIHRTVNDFLCTGPMREYLQQRAGLDFKVNLSVLKALMFLLRSLMPAENTLDNARNMEVLWGDCTHYANHALDEDEDSTCLLLDMAVNVPGDETYWSLNSVRSSFSASQDAVRNVSRRTKSSSPEEINHQFRYAFLTSGISKYVLTRLRRDRGYYSSSKAVPLATLISDFPRWKQCHLKIVSALLDAGADPNEKIESDITPWNMLLRTFVSEYHYERNKIYVDRPGHSIFFHFLRHGARRTSRVTINGDNMFPLTHIISNAIDVSAYCGMSQHTELIEDVGYWVDEFMTGNQRRNQLQLEELFSSLEKKPRTPLRVNTNVMKILIKKGHDYNVNMEALVAEIKSRYKGHQTADLLVKMIHERQTHTSRDFATSKLLKRRLTPEARALGQGKRVKSEGTSRGDQSWSQSEQPIVIEILD